MGETADGMSRQDRIREACGRAVGDHDHSPRSIEDYLSTKDFLPAIRARFPTLRWRRSAPCVGTTRSSFTVPAKSK